MELCWNALLEVCPAACRSRLPNFVFVYMVVVLASWLNVWGGLTESASNWALEWQLEDIKKNVLKWALHWVRSFLYKDVSLVSPGLSKILVELAGRSIQSREIGAALSVRTCEWLVTELPSEKVVHTRNPLLQDFDSSVEFYIFPTPPSSLQIVQQNIRAQQLETSYHLNILNINKCFITWNNFTTLDSQP